MRTLPLAAVAVAALAAASFQGCAAQNTQPGCPPVPLGLPVLAVPQMIYPANGSANVPDGDFPLVLSFNSGISVALSKGTDVVSPRLAPTAVPSPLPTPTATPNALPTPNALAAYSMPALQSRTTYTLSQTYPPGPCSPAGQTIGSFTTR